jgi:hypothetical protein
LNASYAASGFNFIASENTGTIDNVQLYRWDHNFSEKAMLMVRSTALRSGPGSTSSGTGCVRSRYDCAPCRLCSCRAAVGHPWRYFAENGTAIRHLHGAESALTDHIAWCAALVLAYS